MLKIGSIFIDDDEIEILQDVDNYYTHNIKETENILTTKLSIAIYISNYWSKDSNSIEVKKDGNIFKATMYIPIYDFIFVELYGSGETKNIAKNQVNLIFNDLISYNNKYKENAKRNYHNFMLNVSKFGIFYKDRKTSNLDDRTFDNMEIIYDKPFTKTTYEEFIVANGVPKDGRISETIRGYVKNNTIVFDKFGFLQGQKELYLKYIKEHYKEIAEHYNLDENYEVYAFMIKYEDYISKNNNIPNNLIYKDYEFFIPCNKIK